MSDDGAPRGCLAIAHRGASSYAPENTLAAFDLALTMGARHLELDVELTSDGHVVVIHDDTLDRTTDGSGPVTARTLAELRRLDAGRWFGPAFAGERIPTYEDVLERYRGRAHLHTEIKGRAPELSRRTVDLIRGARMTADVTITSFQRARLEEVRKFAPELPAGWLVSEVTDAVVADAHRLGLAQLCPLATSVTRDLVGRVRAEGFAVRAWGVSTEDLMRRVVEVAPTA